MCLLWACRRARGEDGGRGALPVCSSSRPRCPVVQRHDTHFALDTVLRAVQGLGVGRTARVVMAGWPHHAMQRGMPSTGGNEYPLAGPTPMLTFSVDMAGSVCTLCSLTAGSRFAHGHHSEIPRGGAVPARNVTRLRAHAHDCRMLRYRDGATAIAVRPTTISYLASVRASTAESAGPPQPPHVLTGT